MSDRFQLLNRVRRVATADPGRVAYVDAKTGTVLNYRTLIAQVDAVATLLSEQGNTAGTLILQCGNRIEFSIWFLASVASGYAVCPVHPDLTAVEVRQLAGRIRATILIGDRIGDLGLRCLPIDHVFTADNSVPAPSSTDLGQLLLASSGTTGQPKIVCRGARSLDAVAEAMVRAIGFTESDHVLACVPLSHSYGLEHGLLAPLWAGCTVQLCDGFDWTTMTKTLKDGATVLPAVPSMIEMLATLADAPSRMPALRAVYSAGGPLNAESAARFAARFGIAVGQVYGMTEIGSVTYSNPKRPTFVAESVGQAMGGVSIRELPDGEIAIKAASMFDGYLDDSNERIDDHFPTGDLGRVDEAGNLFITGRKRLLIDTGGMKVNPLEIEAVLATHPGVKECVVVAIRQSDTLQRLRAVLVPNDPADVPTADDIRHFARSRLAAYKVPRVIEFRSALPRSAAGKILRQQLEAESCDP